MAVSRASKAVDWDDLRYLLAASRKKTLAGAAREMGVEHSTVGRRLSALEHTLGAPLAVRRPDGIVLTPLGERVVPLVEDVERAVHAVLSMVASEKARVRLAMPSGFTRLFTPAIARLRETHPGISVEISSAARLVDLERGEADLAIRVGPTREPGLVTKKLGEMGWSLYASRTYLARRPAPRDLDDLQGHDIIGYDASVSSLPAAKWIESRATRATVVVRNREMVEMVAAAASGVGLAMLPCHLGDVEPSLVRLADGALAHRELTLVYRREPVVADEVRAVIRMVIEVSREHAKLLTGDGA